MNKFNEVEGDLIVLARAGSFDVVAQGNNCFCVQGAGLAPQFVRAFGSDNFPMEAERFRGDINKLGTIDYRTLFTKDNKIYFARESRTKDMKELCVVNCYSQYDMTGRRQGEMDLDYNALTLCFKKINHIFKGKHIGLPEIGCHLAGGEWNIVKELIKAYFTQCDVTIVHYKL